MSKHKPNLVQLEIFFFLEVALHTVRVLWSV